MIPDRQAGTAHRAVRLSCLRRRLDKASLPLNSPHNRPDAFGCRTGLKNPHFASICVHSRLKFLVFLSSYSLRRSLRLNFPIFDPFGASKCSKMPVLCPFCRFFGKSVAPRPTSALDSVFHRRRLPAKNSGVPRLVRRLRGKSGK